MCARNLILLFCTRKSMKRIDSTSEVTSTACCSGLDNLATTKGTSSNWLLSLRYSLRQLLRPGRHL
jgi:hypothetical protein